MKSSTISSDFKFKIEPKLHQNIAKLSLSQHIQANLQDLKDLGTNISSWELVMYQKMNVNITSLGDKLKLLKKMHNDKDE